MRARYGARLARLRAALRDVLGADITLSSGEAGLHLVLWLPPETCATEAAGQNASEFQLPRLTARSNPHATPTTSPMGPV